MRVAKVTQLQWPVPFVSPFLAFIVVYLYRTAHIPSFNLACAGPKFRTGQASCYECGTLRRPSGLRILTRGSFTSYSLFLLPFGCDIGLIGDNITDPKNGYQNRSVM